MATYVDQLKSGISYMASAGETGRRSLDGMVAPVNGAISEISGAANQLQDLPFIGPEVGAKVQRLMRGVTAAQAKVGAVVATYSKATRALTQIDERVAELGSQVDKAKAAAAKIAGSIPGLKNIVPTGTFATDATPPVEAVKAFPHLLIIQPVKAGAAAFYCNLDTAAFDELQRQTEYRWASQERLSRRPAQQAIGIGEEKLTIKGAIFPAFKGGTKQLDTLRTMAALLLPLGLTTGYGLVLGNWCLKSIQEDQSALLHGGIPRKQGFTLEFTRYGDDLQNI